MTCKIFHAFTRKYNNLVNRITTDIEVFEASDPNYYPDQFPPAIFNEIQIPCTNNSIFRKFFKML
jgi:hypothetical protein